MQSLTLPPPTVFPATFDSQPVRAVAKGESGLEWSARPGKSSPQALCWRWSGPGELVFEVPIGFVPSGGSSEDKNIATFSFWVNCAAPVAGTLRFSFGRMGAVDCWFDFRLGFQGWRTAWVAFERDMQGAPHVDMDFFKVALVDGPATGEILFDHIIPCTLGDPRFHDQDDQVPFINEATFRKNIGLIPVTYHWSQVARPPAWGRAETDACATDIEEISQRLDGLYLDPDLVVDRARLDGIFQQAAEWGFGASASPRPTIWNSLLYSSIPNHSALKTAPGYGAIPAMEGVCFTDYVWLLFDVAEAYRATGCADSRLLSLFLELDEHLADQGWAAGHATGTLALFGYYARPYARACWLMRVELRTAGLLDRTARALAWFYGAGAVMETTTTKLRIGVLDWLNILTPGRLIAILLMPDRAASAALLQKFSDWLAFAVGDESPGLEGGFKKDGAPFHHGGFYMLYSVGAYMGAAQSLWALSRTRFRVAPPAHAHFRKSLLMTRLFSNVSDWPPSLCGRMPHNLSLPVEAFARLALSGPPDGGWAIDEEMARAFLRLVPSLAGSMAPPRTSTFIDTVSGIPALMRKLAAFGVEPEAAPSGHWDMNSGALAIHRRGEWAATAKGHSRYVWSHETYPGENMYGRYLSHGTLFIANGGSPVSAQGSGYVPSGWDWNRWPGATTIHLPWDLLKADLRVVDTVCGLEECLFSDQTFAGGAHFQNREGVFGLNIHGNAKYCADFRALKSVFFFDNRLVCLGSGIRHSDPAHPVETTLFQAALPDHGTPLVLGGTPVAGFPWDCVLDGSQPVWLVNQLRQGYYVHKGAALHVRRARQTSPEHTGQEMAEGDFASAWIDHGCAPKDTSYAYCVVVDIDPEQMRAWSAAMDDPERAHYRILQHDLRAHAVHDRATGITACAIFAAGEGFSFGPVTAVSKPCLLMLHKESGGWQISVCNPNLNLQGDTPPKTQEFTLYAEPWVSNESQPDPVEITLDGDYQLAEEPTEFSTISRQAARTVIACSCRHGLTYEAVIRDGGS